MNYAVSAGWIDVTGIPCRAACLAERVCVCVCVCVCVGLKHMHTRRLTCTHTWDRNFSMICELSCKYWVYRCYRHPLQSCMPCGACVGLKHMHTRRHACTHTWDRNFSMICELSCKYWVDRCYRHPLQSCVPCGACVWGSKHMHTRRHACTHMCDRMLCHAYTDVNQWRGFNTCNYQFLHWKVLLCHWLLVCLGLSSLYGFHLNMDFSLRIATCCGSTGIVTLG